MASQGIGGPVYRPVYGSTKDIFDLQKEALSRHNSLSHDILSSVQPHIALWTKTYGKNFLQFYGSRAQLVVTEPELCKEILNDREKTYPKGKPAGFVRKLLGDGLVTNVGVKWDKTRKVANHAFHGESLKSMTPATVASAEIMLERWKNHEGKEIDVFEEFKLFTSEVISRTAFGSSYLEGEKIFDMLTKLAFLSFKNFFKIRIPGISKIYKTSDEIESDRLEKAVYESIIEIVKKREKTKVTGEDSFGSDFLGLLLKAHHDPNEDLRISIDHLVDECKTLYFAGQETVNSALGWIFFLLALHTEWQEEARKEVLQTFGKEKPTLDGFAKLKTMSMIINEALRLYPPVVSLERRAKRAVRLGELIVPANVELVIPTLAVHHDCDIWGADVNLFKPERFSEGVANATKNNMASYLPFGMGMRTCVGLNFAANEVKIVLSMILQRYSFTLSPAYVHSPFQGMTVRPQHGVQVMLHSL